MEDEAIPLKIFHCFCEADIDNHASIEVVCVSLVYNVNMVIQLLSGEELVHMIEEYS